MKEDFDYRRLKEYWAGKLPPEEAEDMRRFFSDPENREKVSAFMELLWDENLHHSGEADFNEQIVLKGIYKTIEHKKERILKSSRPVFMRYAAVVLLILGLGSGFYFARDFIRSGNQNIIFSSNAGERKHVVLPDGSEVWLNSNSYVSYKESLLSAKRKVRMRGEAFFMVTPDKDKPFEVECGPIEIIVTGTRFNVTAYPSEERIITTLTEGKILLNTQAHRPVALSPGQQAVFEKNEKLLTIHTNVPAERVISWKDNRLVFRNESLQSVFESLGHWYGVTFDVRDSSLLSIHYTATITDEPLEEILTLLSHTIDITYDIEPAKVVINREK